MGTNVVAYCNHKLDTSSGSALVSDFVARFNATPPLPVPGAEAIPENTRWEVGLLDHDTPDKEWKRENKLEFYYRAEKYEDEQDVVIFGPVADLGDTNWSDWRFFVQELVNYPTLDLQSEYWQFYRRRVYQLMRKAGGEYVVFVGDKYYEPLLFCDCRKPGYVPNKQQPDEYPTTEEMIAIAKQLGMAVLYYPVTEEQFKGIDDPLDGILIDDFADLRNDNK